MTAKEYLMQYRESREITANIAEQAAELRATCETLRRTNGGRIALDAACAAHVDFVRAVQPVLNAERARRAGIACTVQQLPPPYRAVLVLRYIRQFSWKRTAKIMGCSIRHVHRLHGHALQLLSALIA